MNQYKDFASIYDELINADIDYDTWANKIIDICDRLNLEKRDYLDLACGTGNMTLNLSKHFKSTWAVDLADEMLTEAEKKLRALNIKAKFVCQDICNLKLNHKFDLITCCLDSTNYILEDSALKKYFEGVYSHMKDNGVFIFDINSYYKLTQVLGNNLFTFDNDDVVYIWENFLEDDIVNMNLTFFVKEEDKYRRFDEQHCERAFQESFVEEMLKDTGFMIAKKLNNYDNHFMDEKCERIVYVLTKTKEADLWEIN